MSSIQTGLYQHYKGPHYFVLGTAKHSETLEDLVVYTCCYENDTSTLWVRPLENFTGMVEVDGDEVPRFTFVGNK